MARDGGGYISTALVIPWHFPERAGTAFLLSHRPAQLPCTPANRVTSSVLPRQAAMPAFPCTVAGGGQGQFSQPHSARTISLDATEAKGEGKEDIFFPLPMSPHGRQKREGSVLLSSTRTFSQGGAVEQGQGYSSLVLQPVWGRANSVQPDPHRSSDNRSQGHLHRLTVVQHLRFRHGLR